jgi:ABC-type glycerol-3-phosphate transport system permease component
MTPAASRSPGVARTARWIVLGLLLVFSTLTLLPFLWMVCASIKTPEDYYTHQFLPTGGGFLGIAWDRLTLNNFVRLFREQPVARAILNSVMLSSVCSVLATLCCAAGGYGLSKFVFPGRRLITNGILAAVVLPPVLVLGPAFETLYHLGLLDTYAGLILPTVAPAFGLYLFRQAMINSVPGEIIESARIDGCGEIRIFFQIVLPLVRPMLGAFLIITFLGTWNNFLSPQIILQNPERQPLSVAIFHLRGLYGADYGMIMAATLISIAPVMALFLYLQREFISGLTSGAVKG